MVVFDLKSLIDRFSVLCLFIIYKLKKWDTKYRFYSNAYLPAVLLIVISSTCLQIELALISI